MTPELRQYAGSAMRLFVGIALDERAGRALEQVRERLAGRGDGLRWSRAEDRHVTLQFLGKADEGQVSCLAVRLAEVPGGPVPVRIAGLGFFARAGVFWAGVERTGELLALQQRVVAATRGCGFVPEERDYHPHITLARQRGRGGAGDLRKLEKSVERGRFRLGEEFTAEEFLLYESIAGADGSRYEVRARFALRRG